MICLGKMSNFVRIGRMIFDRYAIKSIVPVNPTELSHAPWFKATAWKIHLHHDNWVAYYEISSKQGIEDIENLFKEVPVLTTKM
jgi:hypothetical protein